MKTRLLIGVTASAFIASAAAADVAILFGSPGIVASGNEFVQQGFNQATQEFDVLDGLLTEVSPLFFLTAPGQNFTYANDLTVLIADATLTDIVVQVGGFSDYGADFSYQWIGGDTGAAGTGVAGAIAIPSIDVTGYSVFLGNGYAAGGPGQWEGEIELVGVNYVPVPAPGAIALLGLAGLCSRRRRA